MPTKSSETSSPCVTRPSSALCPALPPHALVTYPVFPTTILFLEMVPFWEFLSLLPPPQPATVFTYGNPGFQGLLRTTSSDEPLTNLSLPLPPLHAGAISLNFHNLAFCLYFFLWVRLVPHLEEPCVCDHSFLPSKL